MSSPPTGGVTFFFTDIQGSTRLWERDAKRMQRTLARHDEIMKGVVESHGGFVFKMMGDACCAAFSSAPDALAAALAAQRAIFKEPWDEECKIRVRMALHTGEAEERGGDYFGPPLNRVARLLASGHGGQTLLSGATRERVGEDLPKGVELGDMGEHRLRDLKGTERIFQVMAPDLPSEFPPLKTLEAPTEDDRYRLIRQIGSGGMAEVYLAYDEVLEREVAFKVLDRKHAQNKEAVERFRREARNAASLRHPNIVSVFDRGHTQDGTYYIVMEYMEGGTLEDLIQSEGPLPPQRATEVTLQVARALSVAHEGGVIHRDIKPQNILLSNSGEAKVADFGIARAASATTMTQAGSVMGTVHYISPEQALGEPSTPKSDLYSLGVVLYEMLTGELPYDAETPAGVVMKHVGGLSRPPRETNPEVPEELDAVTARLLARDPEHRYPDASALVEDLERAKEGLPLDAATRKRRTTKKVGGRFQRIGVLVTMALVLVSIGVIAFVALNRERQQVGEGQDTPGTQEAAAVKLEGEKIPVVDSFPPGTYKTDEFEPAFSFEFASDGDHWQANTAEQPDYLAVGPLEFPPDEDPQLGRVPQIVFASSFEVDTYNPSAELDPAPEDMVSWVRKHPGVRIDQEEPVSVGGVPGTRFHGTVDPDNAVRLVKTNSGLEIVLHNGQEFWLVILNDVAGEAVVISIEGTEKQLEEKTQVRRTTIGPFLPKAQKVLKTVEWQAATAGSTVNGEPPAEPQKEWAAGAKKTPDSNPPKVVALDPGKYVTDEFEPAFTFSIGKGWADAANEQSDVFRIQLSAISNSMWFVNAQSVYDVSSEEVISTPSDLTAWFQRHPYLKTSDPTPVSVGGVSGKQFDVVLSEVPPETVLQTVGSPSCSRQADECVPTLILNTADTLNFYRSNEYRVIILGDVAGETVAIVESKLPDNSIMFEGLPRDKSANEKFYSLAEEMLDTVEWEGA
jgi:serine/threonine protein kinase